MSFTNRQILTSNLPQLESIQLDSVRSDYPRISVLVLLLLYLFAMVVIGVGFVLSSDIAALLTYVVTSPIIAAIILLLILLACYTYAYAKSLAFAIREHDVVLRSGVFWERQIVQPLRRVQHVELSRGPVDKRFDLVKVKLFGAGTAMSTFVIPGLDKEIGSQIKQYVLDYQGNNSAAAGAISTPENELTATTESETKSENRLPSTHDRDEGEAS